METRVFDGDLGCLSKSDGSARFSLNNTTQICAVYGPGEVKIMKELADRAYVNVVYKPRVGIPGSREKVIEYTIKSICDGIILINLHPRTAINIILQEIQNDGNYLACALNCACLALLDANIPLKYTFAAVTCALLKEESQIVYFPTSKHEKDTLISITFLFDSIEKDIISVFTNTNDGSYSSEFSSSLFDLDQFNHLLNNARQYAIDKIFPYYTDVISKKYKK